MMEDTLLLVALIWLTRRPGGHKGMVPGQKDLLRRSTLLCLTSVMFKSLLSTEIAPGGPLLKLK